MTRTGLLLAILSACLTWISMRASGPMPKAPGRLSVIPDTETHAGMPEADATRLLTDSMPVFRSPEPEYNWIETLRALRAQLRDSSMTYPRFIQFCIDTYNWVNDNFNSYDPEYVASTGKRGKLRLVTDNWLDSYDFRLRDGMPIVMASKPYSNIGVSVNYSILSVGYSWDLSSLVKSTPHDHKKITFGLNWARINLEAYYLQNDGTTMLRRFGDNRTGKLHGLEFNGVSFKSLGLAGIYIFNWRRFSLSTAYGLSNYQVKSQGSWLAGISGAFYDCDIDFRKLPPDIYDMLNLPFDTYRFDYNSVNLTGGYSYNWVLGSH